MGTFRSNPLCGFLYVPIVPYRSGFAKAVPQLDRGPLDGSVPSVCRPYQRQSKSKAKCTRGARPCLSLSLILPGRRQDAKPPDALPCGRCPQEVTVAFYALRCESTTAGHPRCGVLHALQMSCTSSRLNSPLVSAVSLASSSRPLATWSPLAALGFVPLLLLVPQTRQASLGSSTPYCVGIASIRPQLLDGLQALLCN